MCIHDVPVTLISPRDWQDYQEPAAVDYDVSVVELSLSENDSISLNVPQK